MESKEPKWDDDVRMSVEKLKSLHDGDQGAIELTRIGGRAIPALRAILFQRDVSGLFQTRVRAIDALVALGAFDVLAEFLRLIRSISDPVEKLGEEVVISAAARGVARSHQEWSFQLLMDLGQRLPFAGGVIAALGSFRRREAVPILVAALAEDEARMSAEGALKSIGRPALNALIDAANSREPSAALESESSLRRRRSALYLLIEIGLPTKMWPRVRDLMNDSDTQVALLASRLCIDSAGKREQHFAVQRLENLRCKAGWLERVHIDQYLADLSGE
jgi:HEAT repeat protein